ncbi:MAG: LPS export ABC transporter periplasmic protein LptC [Gammaproteobacteria bacterium]|uniref:LPS export ABC transporter periplasmic protein LptC n=1 Tax=Candidatus Thiopontia autotrophica TaxID=2841688 RepID=A0A8J6P777_9GAMM|nr:LPS export ABC transporter periplasmic protein LptC [Candidatus Thiopontia autotrophica]MBL6969330.1 LPS export ABC transporter periplasmic protein LptC [Gammaproteobacteria bacterium]
MSSRNILTIILILAVATTWYLIPDPPPSQQKTAQQTDYFVVKLNRKQMNLSGDTASTFSADRVDHYPEDNREELIKPRATTYSAEDPPWNLSADEGTLWEEEDRVTMRGNVIANQKFPKSPRFSRMETEEAELFLDSNSMKTDKLITFTTDRTTTTSTGAELHLDTGEIHLLKSSSGHYK